MTYKTEWNLVLRRDSYSASTLINSIRSSKQSRMLSRQSWRILLFRSVRSLVPDSAPTISVRVGSKAAMTKASKAFQSNQPKVSKEWTKTGGTAIPLLCQLPKLLRSPISRARTTSHSGASETMKNPKNPSLTPRAVVSARSKDSMESENGRKVRGG